MISTAQNITIVIPTRWGTYIYYILVVRIRPQLTSTFLYALKLIQKPTETNGETLNSIMIYSTSSKTANTLPLHVMLKERVPEAPAEQKVKSTVLGDEY